MPRRRPRPTARLRPALERFESRQLPSGAGALRAAAEVAAIAPGRRGRHPHPAPPVAAAGLTLTRITNPTPTNAILVPPFPQTLVQAVQPRPGDTYNILYVSVRNSTARTFDASSGFQVRVTGQHLAFPILTGSDRWEPNEVRVFYILTKQYYPLRPITSAGFEFDLGGDRGVAIPGPSGVFLRVRYDPDRFASLLDRIVVAGPGSKGQRLGLPDTSLWEFVSARTDLVPL